MYYLFIIFLLAILVIMNVGATDIGLAGLAHFMDLVGFLLVLVLVIPIMIVCGLHKDFINAFRFTIGKTKAKSILELKRAKEAVILAGRTIFGSGILSACLGAVTTLYECEELSSLGPNMAVSLLCLFYASLFYLMFLPIRSKLEILIAEFMQD